jgi:REP element-mobilizing transposase RayT
MSTAVVVVHAVWSTSDRARSIGRDFEEQLHRTIEAKCAELRCPAIAVGGIEDHVHLLARLHPTVMLSRLIGEAKGLSAYLFNQWSRSCPPFRWQEGYFAQSIDPDAIDEIAQYVRRQREHHLAIKLVPEFELPDWQ